MKRLKHKNILYILYDGYNEDVPHGARILSFMAPGIEEKFVLKSADVLYARKEMENVREKARLFYVGLIAAIGAEPCPEKTLRQALEVSGKTNPWWYHKLSEKQPEGDDTFNLLLQIFTIEYTARREGAEELLLYKAPAEIADVLKTAYSTRVLSPYRNLRYNYIRALLSRLKFFIKEIYFLFVFKKASSGRDIKIDIALQGFWPWSIKCEGPDIKDKYFKELPGYLGEGGLSCAWFLRVDRYPREGYKKIKGLDRLIFVQSFLGVVDILSAVFDISYLRKYLAFNRSPQFRGIFKRGGMDFWPLMKKKLSYGFAEAAIPRYRTMETAYKRAFLFYKPKASLAFLDLYLASRAFYRGADSSGLDIKKLDMQHASYGREKTFILADASREIRGEPDGVPMPQPDYFFTMGELCSDILAEDGIDRRRIFLTGSARYDYIRLKDKSGINNPPKILIAATLNLKYEMDMLDAVYAASEGFNLKVVLRSHPMASMEGLPGFKRYSGRVVSSSAPLEEDLESSDLIMFTYSTVAEEAFLRGIPLIQWRPCGFNGSVFRDIGNIPAAHSVPELKEIFRKFLSDPAVFTPKKEDKEIVLKKCFYSTDGMAARRIARKMGELIK